jgi:hypothetical protein
MSCRLLLLRLFAVCLSPSLQLNHAMTGSFPYIPIHHPLIILSVHSVWCEQLKTTLNKQTIRKIICLSSRLKEMRPGNSSLHCICTRPRRRIVITHVVRTELHRHIKHNCTMLGSLTTSDHHLHSVTPLRTPVRLLSGLLQSQSHVTTFTYTYFLRCSTFTQLTIIHVRDYNHLLHSYTGWLLSYQLLSQIITDCTSSHFETLAENLLREFTS